MNKKNTKKPVEINKMIDSAKQNVFMQEEIRNSQGTVASQQTAASFSCFCLHVDEKC